MQAARISLGVALTALGISLAARAPAAQQPAPAPAQPSVPVDVTACQACHGENGISRNPRVPNLAGQQQAYLAAQLQAFKAGTRHNDSMQAIAGQLGEAEINALAAYWHSQPAAATDAHGATAAAGPAIPSRMTFPANFPAGFTSYERVPGENGAGAERYANAAALAAARANRPLPDGAVIVVVNRDASGATTGYAAMATQAGWGATVPALLRNGNWDYAVFDAAHVRNDRLNQAACLACHRAQAANSFVFTLPALRTRAQQPSG
jgi:cytochrome c553